jgi:hypothetical protein
MFANNAVKPNQLSVGEMSKQNMMSVGGQDIWAKMTSPEGKLTALACHPTKKVNKA